MGITAYKVESLQRIHKGKGGKEANAQKSKTGTPFILAQEGETYSERGNYWTETFQMDKDSSVFRQMEAGDI